MPVISHITDSRNEISVAGSLADPTSQSVDTTQHTHHNRFTVLFPGLPGWAGARRELLDFMVQGKINRGRHTDNPAGRHSIWTNQCLPSPSPIFYRPDALPATQPTVSQHWRQVCWYITVKSLTNSHWQCMQWHIKQTQHHKALTECIYNSRTHSTKTALLHCITK